MKTTKYFDELPAWIKEMLSKMGALNPFLGTGRFIRLNSNAEQSFVYQIENEELIFKEFTTHGESSLDIDALLDLEGLDYFPKLYVYEENKCLLMEKAPGESLPDLIRAGSINKEEMKNIREQYKLALIETMKRKRKDEDFKLEHLFWDIKMQKLTLIDLGYYEFADGLNLEQEINEAMDYFKQKLIDLELIHLIKE